MVRDVDDGLAAVAGDTTVRLAVEDWLAFGLGRQQGPTTIEKYRLLTGKHVLPSLGAPKLRALRTREIEVWLAELARDLSTETLHRVHAS